MVKRYCYYLGFILLLGSCGNESTNKPLQDTNTYDSVDEVLVLDNQENISKDLPLLSAVSTATTDKSGNIYLVDPRTLYIHSYDSSGSHRWSVGGKGTRPDKFRGISTLSVNEGMLYVYEYPGSIITSYSQKGEKLQEWPLREARPRLRHLRYFGNDGFIATGWSEEDETLVNVFTTDFKKTASFVRSKEIFQTEDQHLEKQVFRNHPGSALPVENNLVMYVPHIYDGQIYIYEKVTNSEWRQRDTVDGYNEIEEPVIFHKTSQGEHERSHLSGFDSSGGYFHTEFVSRSHGLYSLENDQIVHISTKITEEDTWDLIVEYFDSDNLELKDTVRLEDFILSQQPQSIPIWMDEKGNLYVTENSDTPFKVFQIEREN